MPTVEERISSLEGKIDVIVDLRNAVGGLGTDLRSVVGELRTDMNRRFDEVDRRFEQLDRRYEVLDQRVERHFLWLVGIQFTVLIAVIVALIQMSPR